MNNLNVSEFLFKNVGNGVPGELKSLKQEKAVIKQKIRVAEHQYTIYCRAVKPYIDSQRIVAQAESYGKLDEIERYCIQ